MKWLFILYYICRCFKVGRMRNISRKRDDRNPRRQDVEDVEGTNSNDKKERDNQARNARRENRNRLRENNNKGKTVVDVNDGKNNDKRRLMADKGKMVIDTNDGRNNNKDNMVVDINDDKKRLIVDKGKMVIDTNDGRDNNKLHTKYGMNDNRCILIKPSQEESNMDDKIFEVISDDVQQSKDNAIICRTNIQLSLQRKHNKEIICENPPYSEDYYALYGLVHNSWNDIDWMASQDVTTHITKD
ncbi:hypothetical protein M758_3G075400 [Ceratodon purpureus]|nr:hypothetical protein M758_3G075400 [Ceratodon purpureus]